MVKSPGSTAPGSATTTVSPSTKFVAPQTIPLILPGPTSTWQNRMGFLNSLSSSISTTRPATTGPVTGPSGRTSSISMPIRMKASASSSGVGASANSRCSVNQLTGIRTGQASVPKGSVKRTSPSTMSRMSGRPLRNCSVRSRPMPKAKPE